MTIRVKKSQQSVQQISKFFTQRLLSRKFLDWLASWRFSGHGIADQCGNGQDGASHGGTGHDGAGHGGDGHSGASHGDAGYDSAGHGGAGHNDAGHGGAGHDGSAGQSCAL